VFIPINLNSASDADVLSIPGAGPRMVREFKEYRPWKTKEQFEKEIGKYVGAKEIRPLRPENRESLCSAIIVSGPEPRHAATRSKRYS
jgi:hypothetical protein